MYIFRYAPVALEQTLEFIRDAVAVRPCQQSQNGTVTNCVSSSASGIGSSSGGNSTNSSSGRKRNVLVGVIGPGSSSVSIQVQVRTSGVI